MSDPGMAKYALQTVPVATPARLGTNAPKRLMGFLLYGGSAATSVEFKNAATDTGTVLLSADIGATETLFVDLTPFGGVEFSTACFCKPAGTGAICYAWYS